MKEFKSVKEISNTVIGKIVIVMMSILLATSIIPELLNARNDFAVVLGIMSILIIIACFYIYHKDILKWLGFDVIEDNEVNEK